LSKKLPKVLKTLEKKFSQGFWKEDGMRTCKHCKQPIEYTLSGLRSFCSDQCRQEHAREMARDRKRRQRFKMAQNDVTISDGYGNTNMPDVTILEQVKSTVCKGQKQGHGLFEDMKPEDLKIAQECCNFETRKKEGYCITLCEPYRTFRSRCTECFLFQALKDYQLRRKAI
jgi:endogenous inhibitor of DNA gyrase (YacG/DUF329 family)